MVDTDKVFAGSIPDLYDDYLVPLIFEGFAADLARRVAVGIPRAVLETAAGSGVVTRALAPLLASEARYVVTDLNQAMLDRAAARQPADPRITFRVADALELPFPDGGFDVVCCQFGAMFFPDKVKAYAEARRVLKPRGRFLFSIWDRIEANVFADMVTQAAAELYPDDPPRFLARTPHGYHDVARIEDELRAAGFRTVEIEPREERSWAASPRSPAIAYAQGTPLRTELEQRDPAGPQRVTDRAETAIATRFGTGAVAAKIRGFVVTAHG